MPILIASNDPDEALDLMEQYDSDDIIQHIRPLGKISLIDVSDETLYVLDSLSNLHQIPMSAPQIRFYFLAAGGQPKSAIQLYV